MNYVSNQNRRVQEETLAESNSDAVETTLILCYFRMTLPLFQVLQNSLPFSLSLGHI